MQPLHASLGALHTSNDKDGKPNIEMIELLIGVASIAYRHIDPVAPGMWLQNVPEMVGTVSKEDRPHL